MLTTIHSLEAFSVAVPFRATFRHARATRSEGESVVVRVADAEGRVGFGECAPRKYVTGETPATVLDVLQRKLAPPFLRASFTSFDAAAAALTEESTDLPRDAHAAFCALELAILDLAGKAFARSAGSVVGPVRRAEIRYGGVVSADGPEAARKMAVAMRELGLVDVKAKVGGDAETDLAVLRGLRDVMGNACTIRVDANGAWTRREALERIESWAALRIAAVEQPVPQRDVAGLAWVAARSPVPIVADESIASFEDAEALSERRACQVWNVRVSKCGGLLQAARIVRLAREAGVAWMLGAQVGETALLSAAGRHLGTRAESALFHEGSYGTLLLANDVGRADLTFGKGGRAPALEGPGLGVDVDEERLSRHVTTRLVVGRR